MPESSDFDVIKTIVDAFERSDWAEIDVRTGSLRIHLSTQPQMPAGSADAIPAASLPESAGSGAEGHSVIADQAIASSTRSVEIPAGAHVVVSPSPGIFWRSPQPGAPPFADVGGHIDATSTMCIVEVMKLMNHVSSGVAGVVISVFVEDGTSVDRGEALFAVEPDTSS